MRVVADSEVRGYWERITSEGGHGWAWRAFEGRKRLECGIGLLWSCGHTTAHDPQRIRNLGSKSPSCSQFEGPDRRFISRCNGSCMVDMQSDGRLGAQSLLRVTVHRELACSLDLCRKRSPVLE